MSGAMPKTNGGFGEYPCFGGGLPRAEAAIN
jgi:hypothetical protein